MVVPCIQGFPDFPDIAPRTSVSCSQMWRGTNSAIPGNMIFLDYSMNGGKRKDFSVCGRPCDQTQFCGGFYMGEKSRSSATAPTAFELPPLSIPDAPKAGVLPTAQHPGIRSSAANSYTPILLIFRLKSSPQGPLGEKELTDLGRHGKLTEAYIEKAKEGPL